MYNRRRTRSSLPFILVPTLMVLLFASVGVFDYMKQHVKMNMLDTTFNVSGIDQILVEPYSASSSSANEYTVSSRTSILRLCKLISAAPPYRGSGSAFATDVDELLFQMSDDTIQVPIVRTASGQLLFVYNSHSFVVPANFLQSVGQLSEQAVTQ